LAAVSEIDDEEIIAALRSEIVRLRNTRDRQAKILQALFPEKSGHYFICGEGGETDANGLPDRITVCAAYGSDVTAIYARVV
jgi:hypothetical protein